MGTFFTVTFEAVSAEQDGDYSYIVNDGKATITGYSGFANTVVLPSMLGGYPTVIIGDNAFYARTFIASITIPDSVTIIGKKAFKSCTSLTSVIIGDGVLKIEDDAFYYCSSLISITIPEKVTIIGNNTFSYCSSLRVLNIGSSVKTIGAYAFSPCSTLTSLNMPNNVTAIGDYAFSSCISLDSIIIGSNVKTIGNYAFSACSALKSIIIPDNVTTIEDGAFSSCTSCTAVTIGRNVKSIGKNVFASCTSLKSITFLGLAKPTSVGTDWIKNTPSEIRGHAYAESNFPSPGGIIDFHGLQMGDVISVKNQLPSAQFIYPMGNYTVNQTIPFQATTSEDIDGSIILYEWDWDNDSVYEDESINSTISHSWTQAGYYPITLRVTDNDNATNTKTQTILINTINTIDPEATPGFELFIFFLAVMLIFSLSKSKKQKKKNK